MKHPNQIHRDGLSKQEKIGLWLGGLMGTMYAFYILAVINFGWMFYQTYVAHKPFDPYPFAFLLFCSNIVQLLWLPLLNVSQNVLNKHAEIKADADFQVDSEARQQIADIHTKLDKILGGQTDAAN